MEKKKLAIYGGVIGVCLLGGVLAYVLQSGPEPVPPATTQAAQKADAMQQGMEKEKAKTPPPAGIPSGDFQRKVGRGATPTK